MPPEADPLKIDFVVSLVSFRSCARLDRKHPTKLVELKFGGQEKSLPLPLVRRLLLAVKIGALFGIRGKNVFCYPDITSYGVHRASCSMMRLHMKLLGATSTLVSLIKSGQRSSAEDALRNLQQSVALQPVSGDKLSSADSAVRYQATGIALFGKGTRPGNAGTVSRRVRSDVVSQRRLRYHATSLARAPTPVSRGRPSEKDRQSGT